MNIRFVVFGVLLIVACNPSVETNTGQKCSSGTSNECLTTKDLFPEGEKAFRTGDYRNAKQLFSFLPHNAKAQYYLSQMYASGLGVKKDEKTAIFLKHKAASLGHEKAQAWFYNMSEKGDAATQYEIAVLFDSADKKKALSWYQKAAAQGHARSQFMLGLTYANGVGVKKDKEEALHWFHKAGEHGGVSMQYDIGVLLFQDDYQEGIYWFNKAADQEHARSQVMLGMIYEDVRSGYKDPIKAAYWFRKAAEQGSAGGQAGLAWYLATTADPLKRNPKEAIKYASLAVSQKNGREFRHTLAAAFVADRQYDQAIREYEKEIENGGATRVKRYQKYLRMKGCYSGAIDGDYNHTTERALHSCIKLGVQIGAE